MALFVHRAMRVDAGSGRTLDGVFCSSSMRAAMLLLPMCAAILVQFPPLADSGRVLCRERIMTATIRTRHSGATAQEVHRKNVDAHFTANTA